MTTNQPISEPQTYPPAPWTLRGKAIVSLHSIDVEKVRPWLPRELEVVSLLPGKTLGGIYLSTYENGSVLNYNELIVFSGLTRYGDRLGAWVTHIYVDNLQSIAGGRNIWGLPKQMAQFHWTESDRSQVSVYQDEQLLCTLSYGWQVPGIQLSVPPLLNFSTLGSDLVGFLTQAEALPHLLIGADWQIPNNSPFATLALDSPWLVFYLKNLSLCVNAPS